MGAAIHGFAWTEQLVAKLERLIYDEQLNLTVIARRFGCSQRTIATKARQLAEQRERGRAQRQAEAA
jgi:hypothetical protein